jgi:hypothetical protein
MVVEPVDKWRNGPVCLAHLNLWGVSRAGQVYVGVSGEGFPHSPFVEKQQPISVFSPSRRRDLYLGGLDQQPPYVGVMKSHVLGQKSEFSPGWGIYPQF